LDFLIEHEEGVWVLDVEGKEHLDRLSGYSALKQGHIQPRTILGLSQPGEHDSTFGGKPLAAAIVRANLREIIEDYLIERASKLIE
jgi:acetylornithine/succinyldiaminopimelate/putrescine aminotransferase